MQPIALESSRYQWLKTKLVEDHPDIDDETLGDTLEGLSDLNELVAAAIRSALDDEAYASAIDERLGQLRTRQKRLKERAQRKRSACAQALAEAGLKRIDVPEFTISLRAAKPRVHVYDEALLPPQFWRTPSPVIAKSELSTELQLGREVKGAKLELGKPSLTVRVK